jgi:protein TonB
MERSSWYCLAISLAAHTLGIGFFLYTAADLPTASVRVEISYLPPSPAAEKPRIRPRVAATEKNAPQVPEKVSLPRESQVAESVPTDSERQAISSYMNAIVGLINNEKRYPSASQRRGQEGRVVLKVRISRVGKLLNVDVMERSPYAELDDAAVDTIRRIEKYPPFPLDIAKSEISFKVPVEYRLR